MDARCSNCSDDEFLDYLFEQAVRCESDGEALDLRAALAGREHLRQRAQDTLVLARDVALAEPVCADHALPAVAGFVLLGEAGRGGTGIVYRARQESLSRDVALKILAPSLVVSARARERFAIEAKVLGRLRHPNIVTVYDVVSTPDVCAYAMEWIDGGTTLARAIAARDPRFDVVAIARTGVAIARALVTNPSLILADEPTGNLDSRTSIEIMALFQELNTQGITIVLVTHEPDIAEHAHRIIEMRDGRIVRDAPVGARRIAIPAAPAENAA
jgi:hypothetical protein